MFKNNNATLRCIRKKASLLSLCLLTALFSFKVQAGELLQSDVTQTGDRFFLTAHAVVHVPVATVQTALTDYEHLGRLNAGVISSQVLSRSPEDSVVEVIRRSTSGDQRHDDEPVPTGHSWWPYGRETHDGVYEQDDLAGMCVS